MTWRIEFGGRVWRAADVNVATLITVAEFAGVEDWTVMNPMVSPRVLAATLTVLLAQAERVPLDVAAAVVFAVPAGDLLDCLHID